MVFKEDIEFSLFLHSFNVEKEILEKIFIYHAINTKIIDTCKHLLTYFSFLISTKNLLYLHHLEIFTTYVLTKYLYKIDQNNKSNNFISDEND